MNGCNTLGQLITQFNLYIIKWCLVAKFHKILKQGTTSELSKQHRIQKEKGDWKEYITNTTNIAKIAIWLTMQKLKNQNNTHQKFKPKQILA